MTISLCILLSRHPSSFYHLMPYSLWHTHKKSQLVIWLQKLFKYIQYEKENVPGSMIKIMKMAQSTEKCIET
jgi:trehalose-6-phosphatase